MTDGKLEPCPFCGSHDVELRESITDALVACNNCGSRTGLVYLGASEAANEAKKREVVAAWNTRLEQQASGMREALFNLSITAGGLVTATDGQEDLRPARQAVLDSLTEARAALSQQHKGDGR